MMEDINKFLPAEPGSLVYRIDRKNVRIVPMRVHSYHLFGSRRDVVELIEAGSNSEIHTRWKVKQFGKTLFPSEEAAAAALFQNR